MYVNDLDHIKNRYMEYWRMENHDRPLLNLTAPKEGAVRIKRSPPPKQNPTPDDIKQRWWDTDLMVNTAREWMDATFYAGEAFPSACPNLGPDIMAAFLGAELVYETYTSYSVNFVRDWVEHEFRFDENNVYWKKIVEMTERFLDDSQGDYVVGVTDLHPSIDCLVSMRGPENLCLDLYDCPDKVRGALAQVEAAFSEVLRRSYEMILKKQRGMTNWMGIYHSDSWYVSSMDFIYLISPDTFDEFAAPCIRSDAKIMGNNIYHLDGVGSLNHLDKLLEMPEIHGVQWVYGAGQPTASHWIDVLKRVQAAGKLVTIDCVPSDMPALFSAGLKPEGLLLSASCESESQCMQILSAAREAYKK